MEEIRPPVSSWNKTGKPSAPNSGANSTSPSATPTITTSTTPCISLDDFLSHANPPYQGRIVYGPGKGHGWMDITIAEMMKEMAAATAEPAAPAK